MAKRKQKRAKKKERPSSRRTPAFSRTCGIIRAAVRAWACANAATVSCTHASGSARTRAGAARKTLSFTSRKGRKIANSAAAKRRTSQLRKNNRLCSSQKTSVKEELTTRLFFFLPSRAEYSVSKASYRSVCSPAVRRNPSSVRSSMNSAVYTIPPVLLQCRVSWHQKRPSSTRRPTDSFSIETDCSDPRPICNHLEISTNIDD